jgi:flagellar protein FliS
MNNPYKQYQKTSVTTAKKEKILLMLYEGAIKFVKQAQIKMEKKDVSAKGMLISKATAILSELMNTLDFNVGGQLAVDLENLYIFMIDQLIEANIQNDTEKLRNVEKILRILYTAWDEVINNPQPGQSAQMESALRQQIDTATTTSTAPASAPDEAPGKKPLGVDYNV